MMNPLNRRQFAKLTAAGACASMGLGAAPSRPNVIIVLADDQGYGDVSAHGHPEIRTPHMDRLRSESVRLTDFHAAPMCTPTRAQLLTGRDALLTRAMNVSSGRTLLRTDLPALPEALRSSGYRTGIFGKWHLGDTYPYRPEDRGFDEAVWYPSSHIGSVPDAWNNDYFNDQYRHNGHLQQYSGYSGDVFFEQAMRWIKAGGSRPFFAYIPLNVAHTPLLVPPEYVEPYRHLPANVARYSAMVANIDANLGRLDEMLAQAGLRDNTILIYASDNGAGRPTLRFNAGMKGNKTELYEGGHRVPCFVRWKAGGIAGGRDVGELAQMQDLFPTLADLCGVKVKAAAFDGISLAGVLKNPSARLPDRMAVVQFSRMPRNPTPVPESRPRKNDAAVLWKKWRLVGGKELYDLAADPGQERNVIDSHPDVAARLQKHYDGWWPKVEPLLDSFVPVVIGSERENPVLVSACEWADVFVDQSAQVRRGERKNGVWHLDVAEAGDYEIALRRWPRDCDAAIASGVPAHAGEDGTFLEGVAIPIAGARLRVGSFDAKVEVKPEDREAVFRVPLTKGRTTMQSWFLDASGSELLGAYYAYVERKSGRPSQAVRVLFDTDIMGDVDDVGSVAALHALANRGEAQILAMGVSSKHEASPLCLDALNTYFGRPGIPIGVNKGPGFLRDTKYADKIAAEWPHKLKSAGDAPDVVALYRKVLAAQPDSSVVLISVGQLTNMSNLLKSQGGRDLIRRKIRLWVCMGAHFPQGREANIWHDAAPAQHAVADWPGRVVFSGFEIGLSVLTGGKAATLPANSPVRRAYELYNGAKPHKSWDQTAVLYGVRCVEQDRGLWTLSSPGVCLIDEKGANTWRDDPNGRHQYLIRRMAPAQIAGLIEELMLEVPKS
jgi:arylsulfatase